MLFPVYTLYGNCWYKKRYSYGIIGCIRIALIVGLSEGLAISVCARVDWDIVALTLSNEPRVSCLYRVLRLELRHAGILAEAAAQSGRPDRDK